MVNSADVARERGESQHAEDLTSQSTYGQIGKTIDGLVLSDDRDSRQIAEYLVGRYKDPQIRAQGWRINPEIDAASWVTLFALEIGHRITLEQKPVNTGSQIVSVQYLERIREEITPSRWVMEFDASPVDPNEGSYFTWGGVNATQGWDIGKWR